MDPAFTGGWEVLARVLLPRDVGLWNSSGRTLEGRCCSSLHGLVLGREHELGVDVDRNVCLGRVRCSVDVVHNALVCSDVDVRQVLQSQLTGDLHPFAPKAMFHVLNAGVVAVALGVLQHRAVLLPDKAHGGWRGGGCSAVQGQVSSSKSDLSLWFDEDVRFGEVLTREQLWLDGNDRLTLQRLRMSTLGGDALEVVDQGELGQPPQVAVAEQGGGVKQQCVQPGQVRERILLQRRDHVLRQVEALQRLEAEQRLVSNRLDRVASKTELLEQLEVFERSGRVFHCVRQLVPIQLKLAEKRNLWVVDLLGGRTKIWKGNDVFRFSHLFKGVGCIDVADLVVPEICHDKNHQQFWHPIMFSMIMTVLHKSSKILTPNNLFLMIIINHAIHTPEIKMGETWQAPQDVPLNDLELQGGKMMKDKDKTMKDDSGDADGDENKEAKM